MASRTIQIGQYPEESALRAGEFELLPFVPSTPVITSQPIKNVQQYTHIVGVSDGVPQYQLVKPQFNVVKMLEGTTFSFSVRAVDPANPSDQAGAQSLIFKWKKDDAYVYSINQANNGKGVEGIYIDNPDDCTPFLNGRWTCEISNAFGTTETQPLDLQVINPLTHPTLLKNLILNGNGEGGLDGWQADAGITTSPFLDDTLLTKNFGSFRLANFALMEEGLAETNSTPTTFRFSSGGNYAHFYRWYIKRLQVDPTFQNTFIKSAPSNVLMESEEWTSTVLLPQIIANEDYNAGTYAGFFPGLRWMDTYNKNNNDNVIGLSAEMGNQTSAYFTREPIKFEKFGGRANVGMTQTIDLNSVADMIDGGVFGINHLTSQFFAYVGIGISDYKFIVQTTNYGEREFNYYVADSEQMYARIIEKENENFPNARAPRYSLKPNTDIVVVPRCYDKVNIEIEYLDSIGSVLHTSTIQGPSEEDIWALKEKVYFPATLLGLFEFLKPNNNTIKVFGQKYTDTNSIRPLFEQTYGLFANQTPNTLAAFGEGLILQGQTPSQITDKAVLHLLNKYDWTRWNTAYPGQIWYSSKASLPNYHAKAIPDFGAAAMIGVGQDTIIPKKTRAIRIRVNYFHDSPMFYDKNPNLKSWSNQELYTDEYGQSTGNSIRLTEYGNSRCGITKMKLLLFPNNISISDKHLNYSLPPSEFTVLGLAKSKYLNQNAFNTADAPQFSYDFIQPSGLPPEPPTAPNPFLNANALSLYRQGIQIQALQSLANPQ